MLTDLTMPGMDGIAFLNAARAIDPGLAGIVMTGHGTIATAVEAMKAGALDYILKPFDLRVILRVLARTQAMLRLRRENAALLERLSARTVELEAANRDLSVANRELEAFSYSVSHDLRSPLRTIDGLLRVVQEDFGAGIPPEAHRHLETVAAQASRMSELTEDLLRLARLGREPLSKRTGRHARPRAAGRRRAAGSRADAPSSTSGSASCRPRRPIRRCCARYG